MCGMVKTIDGCLVGGYSLPPYQTVCETFPASTTLGGGLAPLPPTTYRHGG